MIVAHFFRDFAITYLECHHPGFPVTIEVWRCTIVLYKHSVLAALFLIIHFGYGFHRFIVNDGVFISED